MSPTTSPFFQLLSEAEKIEIKEVQDTQAGSLGEKVFVVKIQPSSKSPLGRTDQEILCQGELLLNNKEYILARNCFSYLLRKNLKDEKAMEGLAHCFFHLREFDSAKKCFKALWELHQKDVHALFWALSLMEEGNSTGAQSIFEKIKDPKLMEAPHQFWFEKSIGNLWMEKKQWDKAEEHYIKAQKIDPGSAAIEVNLGTLYLQKKQFNKAKQSFDKALGLEDKNSKALCGKALVVLEEKNMAEAQQLFYQAVESDSQNGLALLCLSQMELTGQKKEDLIEKLKIYLAKEPHHGEIRFQLSRLLMEQKRFNESYEEAEKALKSLPGDSRIIGLKKILIQNRHRGQT